MCGIIAYSGNENAGDIIINGLQALEYRGYDSAGMTVFTKEKPLTIKTAGRVLQLKEKAVNIAEKSFCGIGHTRWATHGKPSETNAHPHTTELLSVVHNGIIENYSELREKLSKDGYSFTSETDTEVAARLIHHNFRETQNPVEAIIKSTAEFRGSYALCIIFNSVPDHVFAVRKDSPLILGKSKSGHFIASDISAFSDYADTFYRMADGEISEISKSDIKLYTDNGELKEIIWNKNTESDTEMNISSVFKNFMLKEINEEPDAVKRTFLSLTKDSLPCFSDIIPENLLKKVKRIHITACGTAYHAGLTGKYYIEKLSRIPCNVETAGEFRYSDPITDKNDIVIIISQSGETADSLAALRLMKERGIPVISIVNSVGSSIEAESDYTIRTSAGREVSVASTKAFSVQITALLLFACELAVKKNKITEDECRKISAQINKTYSYDIQEVISCSKSIRNAAEVLSESDEVFFIGRSYDSYLATEASLKLKEITYINSQAYPAAELKHGTISLIEQNTPVIAIATNTMFFDKMRSNIEEVRSRGAFIISVCPCDADIIKEVSDISITIPAAEKLVHPFTTAAAIQLLAYYTAEIMGRDIDKPRNLAKSVTVE